jgi:hypothetical protein
MNKLSQMVVAAANGNKIPYQTMRAADITGVPFHVLCAFLEQESAGGKNIFGHDPTIFAGAGYVTKKKYLAYKAERKRTGKMQGVGPMQLTWFTFQDEADALGGCWRPIYNVQVGARIICDYYKTSKNWAAVGQAYNGSARYGQEIVVKINKWAKLLKV